MTRRPAPHPDDRRGGLNGGKLIAIPLILIVTLAALWTAGWFYMASRLEAQTQTLMAELAKDGTDVSCDDLNVAGYPLRLGLDCQSVKLQSRDNRYALQTASLQSAARLYNPKRLDGQASGPGILRWPGLPPLHLNWDNLHFSARIAKPLPTEVSVNAQGADIALSQGSAPVASISRFDGRSEIKDSDLIVSAELRDLIIAALGQNESRPLVIDFEASVKNGVAALAQNGGDSLRGLSGKLRELKLRSDDAEIDISGDYAVDRKGLLNGKVEIRVKHPEQVGDLLAAFVPDEADTIRSAFDTLDGLAIDGDRTPPIPVRIKDGVPSILFIKLPRIPALP